MHAYVHDVQLSAPPCPSQDDAVPDYGQSSNNEDGEEDGDVDTMNQPGTPVATTSNSPFIGINWSSFPDMGSYINIAYELVEPYERALQMNLSSDAIHEL